MIGDIVTPEVSGGSLMTLSVKSTELKSFGPSVGIIETVTVVEAIVNGGLIEKVSAGAAAGNTK
jgi:hypothetical protein